MTMKKMISLALATCMALALAVPAGAEAISESPESTFRVNVVDENGKAIPSPSISLYSYMDKSVVLNTTANANGTCTLRYTPGDLSECESQGDDVIYADYIVYVAKPGYQDEVYTLTKMFSPSGENNYDENNQKPITITMTHETEAAQPQSDEATDDPVYQYLVDTGKVSSENPFYILQPEDRTDMVSKGYVTQSGVKRITTSNINNVQVPIGEFHAVKGATIKVTFYTQDSLAVQSKTNLGSGWSASGSISRNFAETANFCSLTTTNSTGVKQVYYVMGDFVQEDSYTVGGTPRKVIRLNRLRASTGKRTLQTCTKCMKAYSSISNSDGLIRVVSPGTSITYGSQGTVGLSLTASAGGVSLGVTRTATNRQEITCRSSGTQTLKLYDNNTNEAICHVTHN